MCYFVESFGSSFRLLPAAIDPRKAALGCVSTASSVVGTTRDDWGVRQPPIPPTPGMVSKEGEVVPFQTPISLALYPKIHEWLTRLEMEMRAALNGLFGGALQAHAELSAEGQPLAALRPWLERYPDQVVQLVMQVCRGFCQCP